MLSDKAIQVQRPCFHFRRNALSSQKAYPQDRNNQFWTKPKQDSGLLMTCPATLKYPNRFKLNLIHPINSGNIFLTVM